jgi:hypothetical protein
MVDNSVEAFRPRAEMRAMGIAEHEFTASDGSFDLVRWRELTRSVCDGVDSVSSVVCPFGFEFTGDEAFLRRDLRRFYVYLGMPVDAAFDPTSAGEQYCSALLERLRRDYRAFYESLEYVVEPGSRRRLHQGGTRLLYIWNPVNARSILEHYACYLLAVPHGVLSGQLRERIDFEHSSTSRRYLFQVSIALASAFPTVPIEAADLKTLMGAVREHTLRPISIERTREQWSDSDRGILHEIIEPLMRRIRAFMTASVIEGDEVSEYHCRDLHGPERLVFEAQPRLFKERWDLIVDAYNKYGTKKSVLLFV